jgi:hypothetical protein
MFNVNRKVDLKVNSWGKDRDGKTVSLFEAIALFP